jgi:AraC-like DNA-binding protein
MIYVFDGRSSDSSFVETLWRTKSVGGGSFTSTAATLWEMVITKQEGKTTLTLRGPETKASQAAIPEDADFFGISFKLGTFMPNLPVRALLNGGINLPEATGKTFWLNGSAWQFPTYENADAFVQRLVHEGLLVCEPIVEAALQNQLSDLSVRSVQRRFLAATGITHTTVRQIERAREATGLLQKGVSILDTVEQAGYADQPHLTRSLKLYMGKTPAQLLGSGDPEKTGFQLIFD